MDIIYKKIDGESVGFNVYCKDEEDELGIDYIHWKECSDGDWGLSDDGYVGKCLYRREYKSKQKKPSVAVKLCYGMAFISKNSKILYEKNRAYNSYSHQRPQHWIEAELRKKRTKNTIDAFVAYTIAGKKPDWEVLGTMYRSDQKEPDKTVKKLFKQKEVQSMVKEELKKVLIGKGITEEMVLDLHNEAIEMAREKQDISSFLRATENFMDLLDMKPSKKEVTQSLEMGVTTKILDAINSEEKKSLKMSETKELSE